MDPSWEFYAQTILKFALPEPLEIDLREPLTAEATACLSFAFHGHSFAVISPCNPRGSRLSEAENGVRVAALHRELTLAEVDFIVVEGVSPDRKHSEFGVAVIVPMTEATALGARLQQSAIFWFDGSAFWLLPVLVQGSDCRLPVRAG